MLARRPESYNDVVDQIYKAGGKAVGITADVIDESSLKSATETINKEFEGLHLVAAIYNVRTNLRSGRRPFLEYTLEDLDFSLNGNLYVSAHEMPLDPIQSFSNGIVF